MTTTKQIIAEGIWPAHVVGRATFGVDESTTDLEGNHPSIVRVNVEISDGPDKGKRMTYEERVTQDSRDFVIGSLLSVGWKGRTFATVADDIVEGATTTVEVVHYQIKKGKRAGEWFAKARNLGRGPKKLGEASKHELAAADALLGNAGAQSDDLPF